MSELNKFYLMEDLRDPYEYWRRFSKSGLSQFPPVIVTCAITGLNQGKESNPNLPETIDEQVRQAVDAYNAGAVMIHIHMRDQDNPVVASRDPELYAEMNRRIREKCPGLIINNTVAGGRLQSSSSMNQRGGQWLTAAEASAAPEVGSVDITNYAAELFRKKRPAPLFGRDSDEVEKWLYTIDYADLDVVLDLFGKQGIKPEWECFDIGDYKYLHNLIARGKIKGPHWVQMVLTEMTTFQTPWMLQQAINQLPKESLLGIIAVGPAQYPLLAMAMIMGCHVRVGMEDAIYIERGKLAESNAQMVEKIVRIAKELGRPLATPAQAREMMGLGAPRKY